MKRMTLVIGLLLGVFMLSVATTSGSSTWSSYREDVSIGSGHVDFIEVIPLSNYDGSLTNVSGFFKIPCDIDNLKYFCFNVSNAGSFTLSYNLTVNSVNLNSTSTIPISTTNRTRKIHYHQASGNKNQTNITWSFNSNRTCNLSIYLVGENAPLETHWIDKSITIKECDISDPSVGNSKTSSSSFWTVNNSINVTNTAIVNLSDLRCNITYPSHKVTNGSAYVWFNSLLNSTIKENYTMYQKFAPYVYTVEEDVTDDVHIVTIKLRSHETIRDVVEWNLDLDSDVYDDYFDTLDYSSLDVELNNDDFDYTRGSIIMEDFTVFTSPSSNIWTFEWTEGGVVTGDGSAAGVIENIQNALTDTTFGLQNWVLIVSGIALILSIITLAVYYKK